MLKRLSFVLFFILLACFQTASAQDANELKGDRYMRKPLELAGAKVSTEARAGQLAVQEYFQILLKEGSGPMANEGASVIAIIPLGFDVPDFAQAGDKVWEVRVIEMTRGLNAIIWVHSESEKVLVLVSKANPGKHKLLVPQPAN